MKKIALSTILGIALSALVAHSYEQPEPLIMGLSFETTVFDNTDMATAPPGHEVVYTFDSITSQSDVDMNQILLVNRESPPNIQAAFLASIDMETSATVCRYYNYSDIDTAGNRLASSLYATAAETPVRLKGGDQAEAESIVLASNKIVLLADYVTGFDFAAHGSSWEFL